MDKKTLIERLRAMLGTRPDRPQDKWLGDGVHLPVSAKDLLDALDKDADVEMKRRF